jgi:hypothetical protein
MIVAADPIEADVLRLRHEFLSLPGLRLTLPQIARLLNVRLDHADALVSALAGEGFLVRNADGICRCPCLHTW